MEDTTLLTEGEKIHYAAIERCLDSDGFRIIAKQLEDEAQRLEKYAFWQAKTIEALSEARGKARALLEMARYAVVIEHERETLIRERFFAQEAAVHQEDLSV
jgi:hypothetical protein